jgi:glycosyltransferase involved in cell wall biosynthesis
MKKVVFIEPFNNKIFLNQINSLAKYKDLKIYLISCLTTNAKAINIKLKSVNIITRIIHFPTWVLLRFISDKHKKYYLEFPESPYYLHLWKTLKEINPDVIISNHYYRPFSWQAGYFAKKHKIPFILQTEIQRFPKNKIDKILVKLSFLMLKRIIFNNARYILTWTSEGLLFGKKHFPGNEKIKMLPACINTKLFKPLKKKQNEKLEILMVGRFVGYKRYNDLINALSLVRVPYHLNILGSGVLEKEIKNLAKNIEATFLDKIKYSDMVKLYNKNDVLVLPSHSEAIGMVVPEAMACGIPVIISDTVGAKTYVEDKKNGLIFETLNVNDLAKKIEFIGLNKKIREKMGKCATETITKKYSCEVLSKDFYDLIQGIS